MLLRLNGDSFDRGHARGAALKELPVPVVHAQVAAFNEEVLARLPRGRRRLAARLDDAYFGNTHGGNRGRHVVLGSANLRASVMGSAKSVGS